MSEKELGKQIKEIADSNLKKEKMVDDQIKLSFTKLKSLEERVTGCEDLVQVKDKSNRDNENKL